MENEICRIERMMAPTLDGDQMKMLHGVLVACLCGVGQQPGASRTSEEHLAAFLAAKELEGCSLRSTRYYASTLSRFISQMDKPVNEIVTDDIRAYLTEYALRNGAGKVTIDNIRRVISSFFSWLESEDYIYKSPAKRVKKIRSTRVVKPVYSDEALESLRDACNERRDLAMVDLLTSTGMRVGELVRLDRLDIDLCA